MKSPFNLATKRASAKDVPAGVLRRFRSRAVLIGLVMAVAAILIGSGVQSVFAAETSGATESDAPRRADSVQSKIVLSAAIVMAAALLAAGYAVGTVGAAAMGAASERPEIMVRALVFVALAEGIAVWGLIVAVMLIGKM